MAKIESLTPEQEAKFPEYVKKWIAIGTNTDRLDRERCEKVIVPKLYECGKLPAPKTVKFYDGPSDAMMAINIHFYRKANPIGDKDPAEYKEEMRRFLSTNSVFTTCGYGQHDAAFLSWYDFFRTECGLVEETKLMEGLFLSSEMGWFWAYDDICFVSEKPIVCTLDEDNLVHNDTRAAVEYADGTKVFAIHNVQVPELVVVSPEKITTKMIEDEENEEVKRIMVDRYGISRYLADIKATVIDMDMVKINPGDPNSTSMPRALIRDHSGNTYLVGTDGSTNRTYYMNVENNVKTCAEAHNSIAPGDENDCVASS